MTNTTDFITAVYDELGKLLNITDATPSMVMQTAWPAFSLSPADFKRSDAVTGPYDAVVATETLSRLANIAPVLSKTRYENSGYEIDDLYEILISGAIPVNSTPTDIASNPTNKLFADAQYEFVQARRGLYDDPNAFYYPCIATPGNWYDELSTHHWATLTIKSSDVKPVTPNSAFMKAGGAALVNKGVWKLRPTPANSAIIATNLEHAIATKVPPSAVSKSAISVRMLTKPLTAQLTDAGRLASMGSSSVMHNPPGSGIAAISPDRLAAARANTIFTHKNVPVSSYVDVRTRLRLPHKPLDLTRPGMDLNRLTISDRLALKSLIDEQLPAEPASTSSDGFSISFKYCRVNIQRQWLKLALLSTKNWYMCATKAGEYSTGTIESNPGIFPLLPISFIAIRDLKITANWSAEDRKNLANASSFAFFDVQGSTLNANTLEVAGLQVLAWISKLMPKLPPGSPS
jgi:hypothetical protein